MHLVGCKAASSLQRSIMINPVLQELTSILKVSADINATHGLQIV
jgi:hypothetical protein